MPLGFGAVRDMLRGLLTLPADLEPTAEEQGQKLLEAVKDKYGVYQEGWPQLADSTLLRRAEEYPAQDPNQPLLITGGLRDANTMQVDRDHGETVIWVGVAADDPHVEIAHDQEYGTFGDHPIPPRPVLAPTAQAMEHEIVDAFDAVVGVHLRER